MEGVCCNPFKLHSDSKLRTDDVREISENTQSKAQRIGIALNGNHICGKCRLKIHRDWEKRPVNVDLPVEIADDPMETAHDDTEMAVEEIQQPAEPIYGEPSSSQATDLPRLRSQSQPLDRSLDALKPDEISESSGSEVTFDLEGVESAVNNLLTVFNEPVLDKRMLRSTHYSTNQLDKLIRLLRKTIFEEAAERETFGAEIVQKLKKKYHDESTNRSMKFKILSILPDSWSARKIEEEMGTTFHAANISKQLVKQHGVLFDIAKKMGSNKLSPAIEQEVNKFYNDERFSRTMPGIRDYKIVRENGDKVKIQRRLLIMNLKELYEEFKVEFPNVKIGFSTFASLKPPECLTSIDANGIHCVCVCTYHQNVKLTCNALKDVCPDLSEYHKCLHRMICANPKNSCQLLTCKNCPGEKAIQDILTETFLENEIHEITFQQWISVDS